METQALGTSDFETVLKQELAGQAQQLPLQQGQAVGSGVTQQPVTVIILGAAETEHGLRIHVGIVYSSVIAGCSCADDPTPISENTEYCEVRLDIDHNAAVTAMVLVAD